MRVVDFVEEGHSLREAALRFKLAASSAASVVKLRKDTGIVEPRPFGGFRRGKLKLHQEFILGIAAKQPDIIMPEMVEVLLAVKSVKINPSNLSKLMIACGLSYKKSLLATEKGRPDIVKARVEWVEGRQPIMREQQVRLIFLDETSTITKMTRARGQF